MKIIFVASDFSGLGKGTLAASLGRLFKSHGVDIRVMKCDLYYNYDAGTINPGEHGEVYVLAEGTETDQDLGIYERYLDIECTPLDYLTSGRIHHQVFLNERAGKYLGQTVSVEHVIDEIKERIRGFASQCEVGIVELGATIGDIKGTYFLEACRQLRAELDPLDTSFILLSHFPHFNNVGELKTMGCQRSVNDLRGKGLKPDVIVARMSSDVTLSDYHLKKIELFCEVPRAAVISLPDLDNEYDVPRFLRTRRLHSYLSLRMQISLAEDKLDFWYTKFDVPSDLRIALVGKYPHKDAYLSILHQLRFLGIKNVTYVSSAQDLESFDGVILPGGWGERGIEDIVSAARICRESQTPCLGICLGLQIMVIEYARNVLQLEGANSLEFDKTTPNPVVILQETQKDIAAVGASSRLGNWTTALVPDSRAAEAFRAAEITQRHRHRYEINGKLGFHDFMISGRDKKTNLIEIMELKNHCFYIGVQFHPEFTPGRNPIFKAFVTAAQERRSRRLLRQSPLVSKLRIGTPRSFMEAIDTTDEVALRLIARMSAAELTSEGITRRQQEIISALLDLLAERENAMGAIETEITNLEWQMRELNLASQHVDEHMQRSSPERDKLAQLAERIERKHTELREKRYHYEDHMRRYDDAMMRTFSSEHR